MTRAVLLGVQVFTMAVSVAVGLAVVRLRKTKVIYTWLGSVMVGASDLCSTGCEFDSRPCTAGLVLGWLNVCQQVNHLRM